MAAGLSSSLDSSESELASTFFATGAAFAGAALAVTLTAGFSSSLDSSESELASTFFATAAVFAGAALTGTLAVGFSSSLEESELESAFAGVFAGAGFLAYKNKKFQKYFSWLKRLKCGFSYLRLYFLFA